MFTIVVNNGGTSVAESIVALQVVVHGKDEVGMTCEGTGFFARKMLDSAHWLVPLVQRGILKSVQDEKDMFKAQPARTQQQQQQQGIPLDILSFTLVAGF